MIVKMKIITVRYIFNNLQSLKEKSQRESMVTKSRIKVPKRHLIERKENSKSIQIFK